MRLVMMQNVQGAAPVQWPDPTALTPVAATPAAAPARHHEPRPIDAPGPANPYDAMRVQAFRRDAAATASLSSMTPAATATASTTVAPAVKVASAPVVPLTPAPDAPFRAQAPPSPPPVQAPTAVDTGSSSSATRR
jgi:hypothetical protein